MTDCDRGKSIQTPLPKEGRKKDASAVCPTTADIARAQAIRPFPGVPCYQPLSAQHCFGFDDASRGPFYAGYNGVPLIPPHVSGGCRSYQREPDALDQPSASRERRKNRHGGHEVRKEKRSERKGSVVDAKGSKGAVKQAGFPGVGEGQNEKVDQDKTVGSKATCEDEEAVPQRQGPTIFQKLMKAGFSCGKPFDDCMAIAENASKVASQAASSLQFSSRREHVSVLADKRSLTESAKLLKDLNKSIEVEQAGEDGDEDIYALDRALAEHWRKTAELQTVVIDRKRSLTRSVTAKAELETKVKEVRDSIAGVEEKMAMIQKEIEGAKSEEEKLSREYSETLQQFVDMKQKANVAFAELMSVRQQLKRERRNLEEYVERTKEKKVSIGAALCEKRRLQREIVSMLKGGQMRATEVRPPTTADGEAAAIGGGSRQAASRPSSAKERRPRSTREKLVAGVGNTAKPASEAPRTTDVEPPVEFAARVDSEPEKASALEVTGHANVPTPPGTGALRSPPGAVQPAGGPFPPRSDAVQPAAPSPPGTGDTQPSAGATQPSAGATQPSAGAAQPPAAAAQTPAGASQPPTGGTQPPTGATQPPASAPQAFADPARSAVGTAPPSTSSEQPPAVEASAGPSAGGENPTGGETETAVNQVREKDGETGSVGAQDKPMREGVNRDLRVLGGCRKFSYSDGMVVVSVPAGFAPSDVMNGSQYQNCSEDQVFSSKLTVESPLTVASVSYICVPESAEVPDDAEVARRAEACGVDLQNFGAWQEGVYMREFSANDLVACRFRFSDQKIVASAVEVVMGPHVVVDWSRVRGGMQRIYQKYTGRRLGVSNK